MPRRKTSKRWVEHGPRCQWMESYIQWLAGEPGAELTGTDTKYRSRYPTSDERAAKASFFAKRPIQRQLIVLLERRPDIRDYFDKVRGDTQFHARELAKAQIARNFELREKGLELAYQMGDHKSVEHYTRPYVDHGMPKKVNDAPQAPRVIIQIGSSDAQKLIGRVLKEDAPQEIEYEVLDVKQLGPGEEDDD